LADHLDPVQALELTLMVLRAHAIVLVIIRIPTGLMPPLALLVLGRKGQCLWVAGFQKFVVDVRLGLVDDI
jgi:hypothetical protein